MNKDDLPFLGKIKIPLFIWALEWIALLFTATVSIVWPMFIFEPPRSHNLWAGIIIWLIPLAGLIAVIKDVIKQINIAKLEIQEDGVYKAEAILLKWEDVTRYEPQYGRYGTKYITLFFKSGERIRIPGCIRDFKEIENYCLQKLELIGTFEDGRKVSRVVCSISLKKFVLFLLIIAILVGLVIKLIIL